MCSACATGAPATPADVPVMLPYMLVSSQAAGLDRMVRTRKAPLWHALGLWGLHFRLPGS